MGEIKSNLSKVTIFEWASLISAIIGSILVYIYLKPLAVSLGIRNYWIWLMIPTFFIGYGIFTLIGGAMKASHNVLSRP